MDAITPHAEVTRFKRELRFCALCLEKSGADIARETGISKATVSRMLAGKLPDIENYFILRHWIDQNLDAAKANSSVLRLNEDSAI